ncbi:MAG TPA: DsbE family thiol:disulfide interchange protein [Steroidobacteraceae bacterium]|jgi:cytochrome c biogenesis protein CcmG/thiol:disulfide interchange protein DsbE|nr:DsbE family thiol:disulfide interchange protein [Steroidobacteraceae bacterium]
MNRFLLPLGAFLLLATVLAIGIRHAPEKGVIASPLLGKPAPQFSLPSLTDPARPVRSADLKGRWYLFNVWGTWCVECRAEHETLLRVHRAGVVPLIGLDWKDDDAQARNWLALLGDPYQAVAVDRSGRAAIDWGVYGAPETFLVNPQGIVVYKHVGALTEETWTREILPRVSPPPPGKS